MFQVVNTATGKVLGTYASRRNAADLAAICDGLQRDKGEVGTHTVKPLERETTKHGYPILQRKPGQDRGSEIVCAWTGAGRAQPFAVWRMDADGECHGGDYCSTLASAASAFARRT